MTTRDKTPSGSDILSILDQHVRKEFESHRRAMSFDQYLMLLGEQPKRQLRSSAMYLVDMMDHFGKTPVNEGITVEGKEKSAIYHFHLFDSPIEGIVQRLVGHEDVQTKIYRTLKSFIRQGASNKLLLLHGPNGSAKTTLVRALMGGMERYSQLDEGAVYSFDWVFPADRLTKKEMGIQSYSKEENNQDSFAHLTEEDLSARIPSNLRDHPFLLIPAEHRKLLLQELLGEKQADGIWQDLPGHLQTGGLNHRCNMIFEALLTGYNGDYRKVLRHIQVKRFFYSKRYREGLVSIEPQLHVDANYQQLTMTKSISALPPSLQGLNLFDLKGDLIEGNRGIVEYSDLLKRPLDAFKYLLMLCETGTVNVGSTSIQSDAVLIGSGNELHLDSFKEMPDFSSFKARIELIRVPYLLRVSQEREVYDLILDRVRTEKPVAPHTAWTLALWAVLTRLKKPNSVNYPPSVSSVISNLSPLDKAKLYDTGEMPAHLSPDERKLLRSNIAKLRDEYINIPYYEGRMGASAREVRTILYDATQIPEHPSLTPLAVMSAMEQFVKRVSEYEFLKQDVKDGFHDARDFIGIVRKEYLNIVDREVREAIGLYDSKQWEEFIKKYVNQISHLLKKEKIHNPMTGKREDPDLSLIREFETIVEAPKEGPSLEHFRKNLISQVGAWSLDHVKEDVQYAKVFPEYWTKLEKHYYEGQKSLLTKMHNALMVFEDTIDEVSEESKLAKKTVQNLVDRFGYDPHSAREVIHFLMRRRY